MAQSCADAEAKVNMLSSKIERRLYIAVSCLFLFMPYADIEHIVPNIKVVNTLSKLESGNHVRYVLPRHTPVSLININSAQFPWSGIIVQNRCRHITCNRRLYFYFIAETAVAY